MIPATVATAVVVVVAWRLHVAMRSVERMVAALGGQLTDAQRAHEHQDAELHRRLGGIEAAAQRAEREARAVSEQLAQASVGQPADDDLAPSESRSADGL